MLSTLPRVRSEHYNMDRLIIIILLHLSFIPFLRPPTLCLPSIIQLPIFLYCIRSTHSFDTQTIVVVVTAVAS